MSCTAIAKCTWLTSWRSVFCGTPKLGPKSTLSLTSRQRLQREAALAAGQRELALRRRQRHHLVGRQAAQDVDQLARAQRGRQRAGVAAQCRRGAHLDLQVAGGELDGIAVLAQQHVGQDGQRVPALHDAGDRLQGLEELGLRGLHNNHRYSSFELGGSW
jgi:hypothetical protein